MLQLSSSQAVWYKVSLCGKQPPVASLFAALLLRAVSSRQQPSRLAAPEGSIALRLGTWHCFLHCCQPRWAWSRLGPQVLWWPGLLGGEMRCRKQHSRVRLMGCSLFYLMSLARLLASDWQHSWIVFPSLTCPFPAGMDLARKEQDPALAVALRAAWCALPGHATWSSKSFSSLLLDTATSGLDCLKVFSLLAQLLGTVYNSEKNASSGKFPCLQNKENSTSLPGVHGDLACLVSSRSSSGQVIKPRTASSVMLTDLSVQLL